MYEFPDDTHHVQSGRMKSSASYSLGVPMVELKYKFYLFR